jgi:hypothetical protein
MFRHPNPLYDQYVVELNLDIKPQETYMKISSNLTYSVYGSLRVVFLW